MEIGVPIRIVIAEPEKPAEPRRVDEPKEEPARQPERQRETERVPVPA